MAIRIKTSSLNECNTLSTYLTCLIVLAAFAVLPVIRGAGAATSAGVRVDVRALRPQAQDGKSSSGVTPAAVFTVTTTADSGIGSLREAISGINLSVIGGTILFDITGPAPHVIGLATALPAIVQTVTIDGTSNPDFSGSPVIELNGTAVASGDGLTLNSSNNTIEGLAIYGFTNGIVINGSSNKIQGNLIGTNHSGTAPPNHGIGVIINGSSNIVGSIGLPLGVASNIIAFNTGDGVKVVSGNSNKIVSNSIFSNGGLGIDLLLGTNNSQSPPQVTSATSSGATTNVTGQVNGPPGSPMRIEFFSNQSCAPSGAGEGQSTIGFISQPANGGGSLVFNVTLPFATQPGQILTATATDLAGNTSVFSQCMVVFSSAALGSSADLSLSLVETPSPAVTGTAITETILVTNAGPGTASNVTVTDSLPLSLLPISCTSTMGTCGGTGNTVTVTISSMPPGSSAVITITVQLSCSVSDGALIGNTAVVFSSSTADPNPANNLATATIVASNPPPKIICPPNIVQANDPGSCGAIVNFPNPVLTDNCPGTTVVCSPASGSRFPAGTTTVTCIARDSGGATATCTFTVTVKNVQGITLICPGNVVVNAQPGQCTPAVTYQTPLVVDTCPGATVTCSPPSGSSFPVGVTTVTCNAVDLSGATATCSFTVTVVGIPQANVTLEGGGSSLEFGPTNPRRKSKGLNKRPSRIFTVQNTGCGPLVLTLQSILRTGRDVDQGKVTDPDDRDFFSVAQLNSDGSQVLLDLFSDATIAVGQRGNFRVFFNPLIPGAAAGHTDLAANQVLPDTVTSQITFRQNFGPPLILELVGQVSSAVQLINPDAPRNPPLITLTRSGDEFDVQYSVYDSAMDIDHATYQFFDRGGNKVGKLFTADLSQVIRQSNFVRGQSFTLVQKFTGAEDHPEVASVLITVFDSSNASDSAMSSGITGQSGSTPAGSMKYFDRTTIFLAPIHIETPAARLMGVRLPRTVG